MISSVVGVNAAFFETEQYHEVYGVVVHELLHAMGIPGHLYEGDHPTSPMPDGAYRGGGLPDEANLPRLPRIDGEALMTAYEVYDQGQTDTDINPASLGPWAQTIPAINGEVRTDGGTARFGVEYRTQWTRAYDEGPMPATSLAASPLTGTMTWTGEMVGYTDEGQEATSDAGISVALEALTGTAAFNQDHVRGRVVGPDPTPVDVSGNYFTDTGDDERMDLQGQFRGKGREAATGAFRWENADTGNLTGAFGAVRD